MIVRNALTVLIIDAHQERAQYIGGLLTAVGYRPVTVANELDAFTIFLRGGCLPLAVVLGKEDGSNRLFVNRLVQQLIQRYDWEPLMIRLQDMQSSAFGANTFPSPASNSLLPPPSTHTTRPLSGKIREQKESGNPSWSGSGNVHATSVSPFKSEPLPNVSGSSASRNAISRVQPAPNDFAPTPVMQPDVAKKSSGVNFPAAQSRSSDAFTLKELKSDPLLEKVEVITQQKVYLDGQSLGRYQIRARLGSSVYSEVYRTYDRLREQESALKAIQVDMVPFYMMKDSVEEVTVFQLEAELLGPLQHPHILPVLNCGKSYISGTNFIYKNMPLCIDGSISSWIHHHGGPGSFTLKDVMPIILQLADALQFAHNYQVTYQNFKLSNILVLNQAKRIQKLEVALADFSVVQDGTYYSKLAEGFPYMAPERWEGSVYPASDQYGLAAITYELLTGRPPYQGTSEHVMRILHTTKTPQPASSLNPKLPRSVDAVLSAALAKKPGDRFGSVALFAQTLQRC
ncbi:serine/threonine protein kinase [Dictyobacter alpinus]|nr:serine/threonine-protein kinase [Dictyobacter alpinus]